jgi:uncharacterized protein YaiE (UPF0345 family)
VGKFKDRRNYKDYDFNNFTLTINSVHKGEGLNRVMFDHTNDQYSVNSVADGMSQFVHNAITEGTVVIECLEASATNAYLWEMWRSGNSFSVSGLDAVVPDLDAKAQKCHIQKRVPIERAGEPVNSEWTLIATYLDTFSGGFELEAA